MPPSDLRLCWSGQANCYCQLLAEGACQVGESFSCGSPYIVVHRLLLLLLVRGFSEKTESELPGKVSLIQQLSPALEKAHLYGMDLKIISAALSHIIVARWVSVLKDKPVEEPFRMTLLSAPLTGTDLFGVVQPSMQDDLHQDPRAQSQSSHWKPQNSETKIRPRPWPFPSFRLPVMCAEILHQVHLYMAMYVAYNVSVYII